MKGMLAAGVTEVSVWRRPVVTFIPTGNELVQPGPEPGQGQIIEFNSRLKHDATSNQKTGILRINQCHDFKTNYVFCIIITYSLFYMPLAKIGS